MICVLTDFQREVALLHAQRLEEASVGLRDRGGARGITPEESLARREDGSCGELAASLMTGIAWRMGVNQFGQADLGDHIDVKTRPDKTDARGVPYGLRFDPKASSNLFYLLVLSLEPTRKYQLAGGLWGWEIKAHPEYKTWKSNPHGKGTVYWVPRDVLRMPDWSLDTDRI